MAQRLMMPARELARLREDVEAYTLPDVCVILDQTQTSDGQGGFTHAWTAAGTVACRLDNGSGQKANVAESTQPFNSWVLTVPQATEISFENRVQVNGYTFAVIAVSDVGSLLAVQRAQLEWIE